MAEIVHGYVPIYIDVSNRIDMTRCEILPGVRLEKIPAYKLKMIDEVNNKHPRPLMPFRPNYAINIDRRKYREALINRLVEEGKAIEDIMRGIPQLWKKGHQLDWFVAAAFDIVKHVLMSILIIQPSPIAIGAEYTFRMAGERSKSPCRISGIQPLRLGPSDIHRLNSSAMYQESGPSPDRRSIIQLASKVERYYRALYCQVDRIAIALNSFWAGLQSPHLDQMFLSMTIVFEALLTTGKQEITHQMAERAALLLGKDASNRCEIYKQVKNLYGIRSQIVHGNASPKKGLMISAKITVVPASKVSQLVGIASELIRTVVCDRELASVMQGGPREKEGTIDTNISELFQKRLFE